MTLALVRFLSVDEVKDGGYLPNLRYVLIDLQLSCCVNQVLINMKLF